MISWTGHVRLSGSNRRKLRVELLQDRLVSILPIEEILRLLKPIIRIGQVSRVENELILVYRPCQAIDRGVVERWIYLWNGVTLTLVTLDCESIRTVDAEVWSRSDGERGLVAGHSWT